MNATLIHIPGKYGEAIAEHLERVRLADVERSASIVENLLAGFFERQVNTRWARLNTPGVFWRKKLNRVESDALFYEMYHRRGACDSWPMWAIGALESYATQQQRRKLRDNMFKDSVVMFRSGCDVYLEQDRFSGILLLDDFFSGLPPEEG